jgi:hypothetical protein
MVGFGFADEVIDITNDLRRIPDIRPNVGTGNIVPARAEIPLVTEREVLEDAIRAAQNQGATPAQLRNYTSQAGAYIPLSPEAQRLARENADILGHPEFDNQLRQIDNLAADAGPSPISNAGGILDGASTALDLGALIAGATGKQAAAGLLGYVGVLLGAGALGMQIGDLIRKELGRIYPETFLYPDERRTNTYLEDEFVEFDQNTGRCFTKYSGTLQVSWSGPGGAVFQSSESFSGRDGPIWLQATESANAFGWAFVNNDGFVLRMEALKDRYDTAIPGGFMSRDDGKLDNCGEVQPTEFREAFEKIAERMRGLPLIGPYGEPMPTGDNPTPFAPRVPDIRPRVPVFPDFDYPDNDPSGEDERDPFIPPTPPYLPTDPFGPIVSPPADYGEPNGDPTGRPIGGGEPTGNPDPDYDIRNPECCVDPGIGRILELLREILDEFPIENDAALPEIFLAKAPRIKPQCKITYTNEGSSWALTIPQFNEALKDSINLSPYQKGNVMCVLDLLDNSSITLNAISEGEGIRVISELVQYVLPQFIPSDWMSRIKITKYNRNLSTKLVTPKQAKYWSEGDMRTVADWIRKLDS